ncbi:MAG TPA: hypothetical protein VGD37_22230 [Kofleriaceae bacterium]|jgi:hypothetical protein
MSITKLKTVGSWHTVRWRDAAAEEGQGNFRGRVITGMLTGGESISEDTVAPDPRAERAR